MLVFSMVLLLIPKINSDDLGYSLKPNIIDEGPLANYITKQKLQDIDKVKKPRSNISNKNIHLVDKENEFLLDFDSQKTLLENRDAEIGYQTKGIKRFIPNNDSIFSPCNRDKVAENRMSIVNLKRKSKGNRIKIKTKQKRNIRKHRNSKTKRRNVKTDKEEMVSDLIELKPALQELVDEQNYRSHDIIESSENKPYKECGKNHKFNLPLGYTEHVLAEDSEEEEIYDIPKLISSKFHMSEPEISYKGETKESSVSSITCLTGFEKPSNTTVSDGSKTPTVKREFINILTKITDQSDSKASTTVNGDDIKFFLNDRPNKTESVENQDSPGKLSEVRRGKAKEDCEMLFQNLRKGQSVLGQPEEEFNYSKGEPMSTDKKMNQLLKKLSKTTTNPSILKAEINPKQRLKLVEIKTTSQAPLLKRILGGQSAMKATKKPSQALGTEACILVKTHPRRHKGGDPGNHYFHGKLLTTAVCEPVTKTLLKTTEYTPAPSEESAQYQAAHQQTFSPEMRNIGTTTCKNNVCEECQINDLKDILPQPPGKNFRYLVGHENVSLFHDSIGLGKDK